MTDKDKQPYTTKADEEKKKYNDAKSPKAPPGPKKPLTAFFHFLNENREKCKQDNPDIDHKEVVKKLSEQWRSLGEKEKSKFEEIAKKDKERYEKEKPKEPTGGKNDKPVVKATAAVVDKKKPAVATKKK